uniref:Uncharacterized protein n=1 Tax=Anguilla anguilla TaxID=7936 RepID=A0A0E9UX17_ANGAN
MVKATRGSRTNIYASYGIENAAI